MSIQKTLPLLTIGLLVSNRRDTIQKCLDSLTVIREAFPCELVVTDTGCDEDLHQLLQKYADKLHCFTWCNDFAKARNANLALAEGQWYLYLDDDEWFVDVDEIIAFFQSGEYQNYGYASYIQRNFVDMQGVQYSDSWVSRMIRREKDTHFESKIHEYFAPLSGNCKGLHSIVHHYGYVFESEEAKRTHFERNRVLLEEMIAEEPEELRWRIQLAQEYRPMEEYDKLYALGEESLKLAESRTALNERIALGSFYAAKILALKEHQDYIKAEQVCIEAENDQRNTELCRAFLALEKADIYYRLHKYQKAEESILVYLKWEVFFRENEPLFFLQEGTAFIGESFDDVMKKRGYSILIAAGLNLRKTDYLKKYFSCLEWERPFVYIYDGIMGALLAAFIDREAEPVFQQVLESIFYHSILREQFCRVVLNSACKYGWESESGTILEKEQESQSIQKAVRAGEIQKLQKATDIQDAQEMKKAPDITRLWALIREIDQGAYIKNSLDFIQNYYQEYIIKEYPELLSASEQVILLAKGD